MEHQIEILNDAGYYQYSKSVRTTIEGAFRKAMEIADLDGYGGTLNALTAAVGRYLQLEAAKGKLSAAEVGFVIGLAKPETTKFIKTSNYGRTVEELPVDSKGCLAKPGYACKRFVLDPCVCDDVGEPKGQCASCGYKEHEHESEGLV